ncbi:hypothetical protein FACS1894206_07000 [Deltaproteobacteria bacterium]|nr:hypothetical protein FACS1894206_07000 [Deltaproteobacteria bacterium]
MAFFKKKTPVKSNSPYVNGREEWLERYGEYISRAAQWRFVAFLCLLIAVISISGNVIQAVNVAGKDYYPASREEAMRIIRLLGSGKCRRPLSKSDDSPDMSHDQQTRFHTTGKRQLRQAGELHCRRRP